MAEIMEQQHGELPVDKNVNSKYQGMVKLLSQRCKLSSDLVQKWARILQKNICKNPEINSVTTVEKLIRHIHR